MTATIACWTVNDYHAMIESGLLLDRKVELLQGLIVEMSPEGPLHSDLNRTIGDLFRQLLGSRVQVSEGKPIVISNESEPEPDIALLKPRSYRQAHPTADDVYLAIEFANTSLAKDTNEKRLAYAAAEIQDYWVANLRNRQLIVYRNPEEGDYKFQKKLSSGSISPLAFPDITIEISQLLT
jgi:Uma2 family endonuclease